jgi:hypothetical protein
MIFVFYTCRVSLSIYFFISEERCRRRGGHWPITKLQNPETKGTMGTVYVYEI